LRNTTWQRRTLRGKHTVLVRLNQDAEVHGDTLSPAIAPANDRFNSRRRLVAPAACWNAQPRHLGSYTPRAGPWFPPTRQC
jgi:hypothetical protein